MILKTIFVSVLFFPIFGMYQLKFDASDIMKDFIGGHLQTHAHKIRTQQRTVQKEHNIHDSAHAIKALKTILKMYGWPCKLGVEAANNALIIAQNCNDIAFKEYCLHYLIQSSPEYYVTEQDVTHVQNFIESCACEYNENEEILVLSQPLSPSIMRSTRKKIVISS